MPSFWKSYPDRQLLETIYEGYLRLSDSDYAGLYTDSDNSDLSTLRPTRYQPLHHQIFDDWEQLDSGHAHEHLTFDWPEAESFTHTVRVPDIAMGDKNIIFVDGVFMPSFLYRVTQTWWVEAAALVRGTELQFDSRRLSQFFEEQAATSSTAYTTGTGDPSTFSKVYITTLNHREIIAEESSVDELTYTFGDEYDIGGADIFIEFADITREATITVENGIRTRVQLPADLALGQKGFVILATGALVQVTLLPEMLIDTVGTSLVRINMEVGYQLNSEVLIEPGQIQATTTPFLGGTTVSISDSSKTTSTRLSRSSTAAVLDCGNPQPDATIRYFGTDIRRFNVAAKTQELSKCGDLVDVPQQITFAGPLQARSTFKVVIPKVQDHSHVRETLDPPLVPNVTATLSQATSDLESPMVFLNGVRLQKDVEFAVDSATVIRFLVATVAGDIVEAYYDVATDVPHAHRTERQSVSSLADLNDYTLKDTRLTTQPLLVLESNALLVDGTDVSAVDQDVSFVDPLDAGTLYSFFYTTFGRKYRHLIPYIEEDEWNYKGRLKSAEALRNGIEVYSMDLTPNDFELVKEGDKLYVYTDEVLSEGWWVDAQIDDKAIPDYWGTLVGVTDGCDDTFARAVGALVSACRSSSSAASIDNFGSILLGSEFTTSAGFLRGISNDAGNILANIKSVDNNLPDYTLNVSPCADLMLSAGECLPRYSAVNQLVTTQSLADLDDVWLAIALDDLADDISAATRMDQAKTKQITSVPFSYDEDSRLLTDFSVNFIECGVTAGSLLRAQLGFSAAGGPSGFTQLHVTTVIRVISEHVVEVEIPIVDTGSGAWSDNGYSSGPWSGGEGAASFVSGYTVWGRDTDRLDTGFTLDKVDEDRYENLKNVASAFNFAIQVNWSAVCQEGAMQYLKLLLEKVRPADTQYFIYTEALSDNCSKPLQDTFAMSLFDEDPSYVPVGNAFYMEESFIGLESVVVPNDSNASLYQEACPTFGTFVKATIEQEPTDLNVGDYVITTSTPTQADYVTTYSTARGIENELLRITDIVNDVAKLEAQSNIPARPARGLRFDAASYIQIDTNSSDVGGVNRPFAYASGLQLTLHCWVDLTGVAHAPSDTPTLFSWGDIEIDLETFIGGQYTPRVRTFEPTPLLSDTNVLINTTNLISVTYGRVTGEDYYETILYVNGVETARTTSTDPVLTKLPSFNDPGYLGRNVANDLKAELRAGLLLFDARVFPQSAGEIEVYYNGGAGQFPPMGIDTNGSALTSPNAFLTYQFHSTWPDPVVPDYSGNAFNAVFVGTHAPIYGDLLTPQAQADDCHIITRYTTADGLETPVPRATLFNPPLNITGDASRFDPSGTIYAGGADINSNLLTLNVDGSSYSLPNVAFCAQGDHTWVEFNPGAMCPTAAIEIDESDLFTGFTV